MAPQYCLPYDSSGVQLPVHEHPFCLVSWRLSKNRLFPKLLAMRNYHEQALKKPACVLVMFQLKDSPILLLSHVCLTSLPPKEGYTDL